MEAQCQDLVSAVEASLQEEPDLFDYSEELQNVRLSRDEVEYVISVFNWQPESLGDLHSIFSWQPVAPVSLSTIVTDAEATKGRRCALARDRRNHLLSQSGLTAATTRSQTRPCPRAANVQAHLARHL